MSSDDDWDKVVNFEAYAYEKGVVEANSDSLLHEEAYDHGRNHGFQRGYSLAFELSFYAMNIQIIINDLSSASEKYSEYLMKDRLHKRCLQLLEKCSSLPDHNHPEFDFQTLLNEMRTLYKLIGKDIDVPSFQPLLDEAQSSHDW